MPEMKALANHVKAFREAMKESQEDFSANTGVSVEEISLIEREKANPKLSTMQRFTAYMDITVADLLQIDEEPRWLRDIENAQGDMDHEGI